jgi:hypothetical protein
MRMRLLGAAAIIALLAGPAVAQQEKPVPRYGDMGKDKTWGELQQEKEADQAYKRSLGNVPDKGPVDPWGNTRSAGEPKTAKTEAKMAPVKPKAKAGDPAK